MAHSLRYLPAAALLGLGFALTGAAPSWAGGHNSLLSKDLCASLIARAERRHGIPERLLRAISLAETGRVDPSSQAMIAWPWAVNAGGQGRFYASKAEAIAAVRRLKAEGARNIDVGCMQVNLMHHPKAFASLKTAFDPAQNVAYAARFLKELHAKTGSWIDAVAAYHSSLAPQGTPYMLRVLRIWVDRRARPQPTVLAARGGRPAGAIATSKRAKPVRKVAAAKARARSASLVRRATARSPEAVKRRWAEVVARRKRFAEWLAQRHAERLAAEQAAAGNPG
jgi:Transglycosylase SLT domain